MRFQVRPFFAQLVPIYVLVACSALTVLISGHAQTQVETKPLTSGGREVTGRLRDYYGPISRAEVYLNSMNDEDCAKLFHKKMFEDWKASRNDLEKLKACITDVGPVEPDSDGVYTFSNLPSGYYALVVSWNTKEEFKHPILAFKKGEFIVTYYKGAKYNAVSTGQPFYFTGTEDTTRDFDFTKGIITKETTP